MGEGVAQRRGGDPFGGPLPERAAGSGQPQVFHLPRRTPGEALENRGVFAVHRNDLPAGAGGQLAPDQFARHHHHLLAGQRDPLPGPQRGDHRLQPAGADDRAEHGVGFGGGDQVEHRGVPGSGGKTGGEGAFQLIQPFRRGGHGETGTEQGGLPGQFSGIVARDQPDHPEMSGQCFEHPGGALADGTGRAEYHHAFGIHLDSTSKVTGPSL